MPSGFCKIHNADTLTPSGDFGIGRGEVSLEHLIVEHFLPVQHPHDSTMMCHAVERHIHSTFYVTLSLAHTLVSINCLIMPIHLKITAPSIVYCASATLWFTDALAITSAAKSRQYNCEDTWGRIRVYAQDALVITLLLLHKVWTPGVCTSRSRDASRCCVGGQKAFNN